MYIALGKIGAPFGLKGAFHVYSFTEPADNLLDYAVWYLDNTEYVVESCRSHGTHFVAQLKDIESIDQARMLTNLEILVPKSSLPELEEGTYYFEDLIGCQVKNAEGFLFGKVTGVMPTPANDVLVVGKYLIPYVESYVLEVDLDQKEILVDWQQDYL
ncbi:MAG: ribosome maturation factor RimM [Gammaproteobacteria bacterium]